MIVFYLLPVAVFVTVVLGALSDKEMQVCELLWGGAFFDESVDDLNEELFKFLTRDWANFIMVETADE